MNRKNVIRLVCVVGVIFMLMLLASSSPANSKKKQVVPVVAAKMYTEGTEPTEVTTIPTIEATEATEAIASVAEFEEVLEEEVAETTEATEPVETPQETEAEIVEVTETAEEPTESTEPIEESENENEYATYYTYDDAVMLAITMYGEARGLGATEQACVAWTILNRVDDGRFGSSIAGVITAPGQFHGYYSGDNTIDDDGRDLVDLALDVLDRWNREKNGETDVGRVLPSDYLYFAGSQGHNWFRTEYDAYDYWDYSWGSPYES